MTGSMGQVNLNNKYPQPENFNGKPAFAPITDNTLVKKALDEQQEGDSFSKSMTSLGLGIAGCYGLDKSTNYLIKGDQLNQTKLYKLQNWIDNSRLGQSSIVKNTEKFIENLSTRVQNTHTNLLNKPWYQEASARFTKGMKIPSHLAFPLAKEGLVKEYAESVQKMISNEKSFVNGNVFSIFKNAKNNGSVSVHDISDAVKKAAGDLNNPHLDTEVKTILDDWAKQGDNLSEGSLKSVSEKVGKAIKDANHPKYYDVVNLFKNEKDAAKLSDGIRNLFKKDFPHLSEKLAQVVEDNLNNGKSLDKIEKEVLKAVKDLKNPKYYEIVNLLKTEKDFQKVFSKIKDIAEDKSLIKEIRGAIADDPKIKQKFSKIIGLNHITQKGGLLSKFLLRGKMETSHFLGGSLGGVLLNGYFLSETIKNTINAKKGEKLSTFMEEMLSGWIGGFVLMIPASKVINGVRGFTDFQASQGSGFMKKAGAKMVRGVAKLLNIGKDHTLAEIGKTAPGFKKKAWAIVTRWLPKALPGGIIRGIVAMLLVYPFQKALEGVSHMIFGKPTHPEEKPETPPQPVQPQDNSPSSNIFSMNDFLNKTNPNQQQVPKGQPQATKEPQTDEPVRTYIPSSDPVVLTNQPNEKFDKLLRSSDNLMKMAEGHIEEAKGRYRKKE